MRFKVEDDLQWERIEAWNNLESYAFSAQSAVREHGEKLSTLDKEQVERQVQKTLDWLDSNGLTEKEEFEHKLKELQGTCSAIMTNASCLARGPQVQEATAPVREEDQLGKKSTKHWT